MTDPHITRLALRLWSIEQRHDALARARQLPASSVLLPSGETARVGDAVEAATDTAKGLGVLDSQVAGIGGLTDTGAENASVVPGWITSAADTGSAAFDAAVIAYERARTAKAEAEQAIDDAANALTTSNGKNSRRRGQTEPAPPPGGWVQGDQWVVDNDDGKPYELRVWDGDEFVFEQLLAAELLVVSGGGVIRLANGVVTADAMAADAIDGMTITGALIRTAATGLRFEMDALGLRAFNASNAVTASLAPESGGLLLSGSLTSYPGGNTSRAVLSNGGLIFDLPGSGGAGNLAISPGNIRSSDSSTRLFIAKDSGSAGTGLTLQAGVSPGSTAQIHVNGDVTGGLIELAAGTVRKSSDYTWAKAGTTGGPTLKTGWTNRTSLFDGLALQSKLDEVFLNGTIEKNSSYSALDVIATLPVGCRPTRLIAVNASYAGTLEYVLVYPNGDVAVSRGGTSATWINIFGGFPTT